jgi:multiple sugar transport system substrate-binding protein
VAPLVHPGKTDWNVWQNSSMWMWGAGASILSADNKKAAFNSPEAIQGVATFTSFYGKGLTSDDTLELNSAKVDERMGNGKAALAISGPWLISNARSPKDKGGWEDDAARANLGFAEFPAGPAGQYTFVGGSNLSVLKNCPSPAAAAELVKFLVNRESQTRYTQAIGMLPVKQDAQKDAAFANDPLYSVFLKAAAKGKTSPAIPQWGQVEPAFQEQLQAVWEDVAAAKGKPLDADKIKTRLDAAARTVDNLLK